jgi:hypothetical protein
MFSDTYIPIPRPMYEMKETSNVWRTENLPLIVRLLCWTYHICAPRIHLLTSNKNELKESELMFSLIPSQWPGGIAWRRRSWRAMRCDGGTVLLPDPVRTRLSERPRRRHWKIERYGHNDKRAYSGIGIGWWPVAVCTVRPASLSRWSLHRMAPQEPFDLSLLLLLSVCPNPNLVG